jgi:hypothetical protein
MKMMKILQATESMFELTGDVPAVVKPFDENSKLLHVSTRKEKADVELIDDIAKQLGVSRASFISMAIDDAIKVYQCELFERGITDSAKFPTMRGFNPEEDM